MYTVIDIETTGLSKHQNKITEIAAARVVDGEVREWFQTLVNPQVKIPSFITKLTGINDRMVQDAPIVEEVLPRFMKFLKQDVFVAHNATFDHGFLNHNLQKHHEQEIVNNRLCTKKLANRLLPELPRKRLQDLCRHMNVQNNQAHRAMSDVAATVKVFNTMLQMLEKKGIHNVHDILKFEKAPRAATSTHPPTRMSHQSYSSNDQYNLL